MLLLVPLLLCSYSYFVPTAVTPTVAAPTAAPATVCAAAAPVLSLFGAPRLLPPAPAGCQMFLSVTTAYAGCPQLLRHSQSHLCHSLPASSSYLRVGPGPGRAERIARGRSGLEVPGGLAKSAVRRPSMRRCVGRGAPRRAEAHYSRRPDHDGADAQMFIDGGGRRRD